MSPSIDALRLSQIETLWSIVGIAHGAASQEVILRTAGVAQPVRSSCSSLFAGGRT